MTKTNPCPKCHSENTYFDGVKFECWVCGKQLMRDDYLKLIGRFEERQSILSEQEKLAQEVEHDIFNIIKGERT